MSRSKSQTDAIAKAVANTLRKDFENIRIVDIRILEPDEFMDDDEDFVRIEVVFEADPKDRPIFSKVVRHVRPELDKIGESAFPIFSFTALSDMDGKAA